MKFRLLGKLEKLVKAGMFRRSPRVNDQGQSHIKGATR